MFSKKGSWRVGSGWTEIFGENILLNNVGLYRRRMIHRHKILNVFWVGSTAIKGSWAEVDVARPCWLNWMDSHQRKLKCMYGTQDRILQQGEANECHSEGSRHLWNQGDHHDGDGSWCEPWWWVECTGCKPSISNKLPDHDDMAAWMSKFVGLKVQISPWNTLGQIRCN